MSREFHLFVQDFSVRFLVFARLEGSIAREKLEEKDADTPVVNLKWRIS